MTKGDLPTTIVTSFAAAGNWCLWLSQAPLVWQLIQEGDAANYSWLPSLTLVGCMSLWSGYAEFTLNDPSVLAGNWSGVAIPLLYLCVFFSYTKTATGRLRIAGATLLTLAAAWTFILAVYLSPSVSNPGTVAGGVIVAVNMTFFISPLRALWRAAALRDLSHVSVLLSCIQLVQSSFWVAAACMLPDSFVLLVNAIGLGFACVQLVTIGSIRALQLRDAARAKDQEGAGAGAPALPADVVAPPAEGPKEASLVLASTSPAEALDARAPEDTGAAP